MGWNDRVNGFTLQRISFCLFHFIFVLVAFSFHRHVIYLANIYSFSSIFLSIYHLGVNYFVLIRGEYGRRENMYFPSFSSFGLFLQLSSTVLFFLCFSSHMVCGLFSTFRIHSSFRAGWFRSLSISGTAPFLQQVSTFGYWEFIFFYSRSS